LARATRAGNKLKPSPTENRKGEVEALPPIFNTALIFRSPSLPSDHLRFIGSFVADAHRILLHGGVLGVPGDIFDCPKGSKLLVYECSPLAYIFKCAGGDSTDGHGSVLDTIPSTLKQVSPIFLGSKQNVQELVAALNG